MAGKKDTGSRDERPRDIGDDQQAGFHAGENFQARDRGQVEDAQDRGSADVSRRLAREAGATPTADTAWESRVERGEEWTSQEVPKREARGDEEPDSTVSRRGLVHPPPEE